MSPALALLLAAALGAETQVEAGIGTEVRLRRLAPAPTPAQKSALDLSATPRLTLGLTGAAGSLSASYTPRLTAADVGPDRRWEHMHEGELRLRLGSTPLWRVDAFASGGIGRTDLLTESRSPTGTGGGTGAGTGTGTGAGSAIPTVSTLDLMRLRTGLSLLLAPDRRTELVLSAAVSEDGGTNQASRTQLPIARAAEAGADLRWRATRIDQLGLRLAAARTRISALETDSAWASGLATWRRQLDPQVEVWSGAGAVALQSKVPRDPPDQGRAVRDRISPAGELGVARTAERREVGPNETVPRQDVTGQLAANLGASVDRLTGAATPSLDLRGDLRWPAAPKLALLANGTGTLAWPDTGRTWRAQLELSGSFQLTPRMLLDVGAYGSRQRSTDPGVVEVDEYGAFLRFGADLPPLRF